MRTVFHRVSDTVASTAKAMALGGPARVLLIVWVSCWAMSPRSFAGRHEYIVQRGCFIYQGISYEYPAAMVAVGTDIGWPSLCTISAPDGVPGYGGAPSGNYTPVSGLVAVPCRDAVTSASIQATELKALQEIESKGLRHLLLNGYYPQASPDGQIPTFWRAVVDGITYNILGVEHDSETSQTRLELEIVQV